MANKEKFTQLPTVTNAALTDIIRAVQGGDSVQETLQQVFNIMLSNTILNNAGDPNGNLAGSVYQFCWDTTNEILYICTTTGNSSTAVWAPVSLELPVSLSEGGTGKSLTAANGGIVYSDANSFEILSPTNASGRMLQSGNASAPSWSTPTYPSTSGTAGQVLASNGTNIVYSSISFPVIAGAAGSVIISDGLNWVESTSLFPNTVGSSGTILRSNGTANTYSTSTFADTYTVNNILYASSSNTVTGLATANNGVLVTSAGGVPSISNTLPSAVQANITTVGTISSGVWNGTPIGLAYGGTNANLTASNGGIFYSTGTAGAILAGTATANQVLLSGSSAAPSWSTATFASTYSASNLLYSNGANTVTGLATANSATLVTNSSGVPAWTASMTNGQILIGSTGATPTPSTLTAGTGISISNAAGSITISGSGGGYSWTEVTGTSQSMSVNNGYIANNAGLVTLTLPSTAAIGDTVIVQGKGTGLFSIAQNSGQTIHFGSNNTTTGVGGSLTATNRYDSLELLCITANTDFAVLTGAQGTFNVV